ncbi:outer membrane beta-barrel protein [Porticoccus sp. W117]|nr:outer membrane beta-barrel protein [Porticoccus sp. W117]
MNPLFPKNRGKKLLLTALASSLLIAGSSAFASDDEGAYVSINYGIYDIDSVDANSPGRNVNASFDDDGGFGFAVGYQFEGNAWGNVRVEFNYENFDNDAETVNFNGNLFSRSAGTVAGDVEVDSYMLNVTQELAQWDKFTPYAGFGLGIRDIDANFRYNPTLGASIDDSDTVFAYQAFLGLDYSISEPLTAFVEYRFQDSEDADLNRTGGGPGGFQQTIQDSDFDTSDSISLGLRYQF